MTLRIHFASGLFRCFEMMHSKRDRTNCIWISSIRPGGLEAGLRMVKNFQLTHFEDRKGNPAEWPVKIEVVSSSEDLSVVGAIQDAGIRLAALR